MIIKSFQLIEFKSLNSRFIQIIKRNKNNVILYQGITNLHKYRKMIFLEYISSIFDVNYLYIVNNFVVLPLHYL